MGYDLSMWRRLIVLGGLVACVGLALVAWYADRVIALTRACADTERGAITTCAEVRDRLGEPGRVTRCGDLHPSVGRWPRHPTTDCADALWHVPPLPVPPVIGAWACGADGRVVDFYRFESP
jgi:hypothetical protein